MGEDGKVIIVMFLIIIKKDGIVILKIVFIVDEGVFIMILRNDVDYIVIEYGIVELKGKFFRERVRNLINIVYLSVRESLVVEFEKRFKEKY